MSVDRYAFGSITVGGATYRKDVIIFPDRVLCPWWRKDGHSLDPEDLDEVTASGVKTLIIGTGASGVMKVPPSTLQWLAAHGIVAHVLRTGEAVELYNSLSKKEPTVAALHLTC